MVEEIEFILCSECKKFKSDKDVKLISFRQPSAFAFLGIKNTPTRRMLCQPCIDKLLQEKNKY